MFKNQLPFNVILYSSLILIPFLIIAMILQKRLTNYCIENEDTQDKKIIKKATLLRITVLLLFSFSGCLIGNMINLGTNFATALSHGMTTDPETGSYYITFGEMITYNKNSVKETNVKIDDLTNKAIIFVRYDCPDCLILHDQLAEIDDIIFLSTRSELGKSAMTMYDIQLTEVPQGVYIDAEGNSTIINIMVKDDSGLKLDLQQIAALREMVNSHNELSTE